MNDELEPLPDLPEPFAAQPRQPPQMAGGCGKVALIGCGALVLLFGIGMVLLMWKADEMLVWVFQKLEAQVVQALPADLPAEERERLEQGFDDLYAAVQDRSLDPAALQALQRQMLQLSRDLDGGLSRSQVRELIQALERAAGKEPPAEEARPVPPGSSNTAQLLRGPSEAARA